jgi:PAS domain S-box-containing protein
MINNITEKKQAEERLAREQVLLRTLIDNLPQTIYVKDLKKRKILANRADFEIIGKSAENVIGKTDSEVYPKGMAIRYEADDERVMSTKKAVIDREELIVNVEGKKVWFLTSKIPLFDHEGNITGLVGIGHDITSRKNAEDELKRSELKLKKQNDRYISLNKEYAALNSELSLSLEQIRKMNQDLQLAKEKAEESDKLKSAFLNNISHEIRTPLNAIIGFTTILAQNNISPEKREEFVNIIFKSNDQLLSIISSIIALASLESGQESLNLKETDINQLLNDVYEQFLVTNVNKEVTISYQKGLPDNKAITITDPVKLMQILVNLVENALKFTPKGYVRFGYKLDNDILEFFIEDSGIGIPGDMHNLIFERFRQIDNSATRKYGGTGLGLALSKGYAQLLEGAISVLSSPGTGSKFLLKIPYKPVSKVIESSDNTRPTDDDFTNKRTLLVTEDEDINFTLLSEILSDLNLSLYRAENGLEALNFCSGNIKPYLVLMDMKMPVMDGIEATKRIKQVNPGLPVIALTAYTSEADKRKFIDAGCDYFIEKPFHMDNLISTVVKYLTKS